MSLSRLVPLVILLILGGCQSTPVGPAQKAGIRRTLHAFQLAINARSTAELDTLLAPNIQVGGASPELSHAGLMAGSAWTPFRVADCQILSLKRGSDGPEAKIALYSSKVVMTLKLGFDEDGRIRTIDADPLWKIPEPSVPNVLTSRFVVSGGLLFVKATVNRKPGYMLFDTGSSNLLLNPKYFAASGQAMGVSATVNGLKKSGGTVKIESFQWEGLRAGDIEGELHDFSSMEKPGITPLLGAISHAEVKNCAVLVDWKEKNIQVFATKPDGAKKTPLALPAPAATLPFTYFLHLPLLTVHIADHEYPVLFDSGAQWNLLPDTTGIEPHFHPVGRLSGFSDGGQAVANASVVGVVDQTQIAGATFRDLPYAIFQIPYFPGKGFLGAPLFQSGRMEINFRSKQISFWQ